MTTKKKAAAKKPAAKKAKAKPAKAKAAAKATPAEKPLAYNIGPQTVTVFFDGRAHTVAKSTYIASALRDKNWSEVRRLCAPAQSVLAAGAASGFVKVSAAGVVTFKNRPINNASAKRIVELMRDGFPIESELRTLESLMRHDDQRVIESFESYLDKWRIPRLETGQIVLVKRVKSTGTPGRFVAGHDGKFPWNTGETARMQWDDVCRDPSQACMPGLHACPLAALHNFSTSGDVIIELHVWPEHIAALPNDYLTNGKVRLVEAYVSRELPADVGETDLTGRA